MDQDYLLIGVDVDKKFAVRFLSLKQGSTDSLALKKLPSSIQIPYLELLLGSVLLASRSDGERESILYKLQLLPSQLRINSEVNPQGSFRSAVFPHECLEKFDSQLEGHLQVTVLNKKNQVYTSSVKISPVSVKQTLRDYLQQSVQTQSILEIHADAAKPERNFALWIERLPGTSDEDWKNLEKKFPEGYFKLSFTKNFKTEDPDVILQNLLPFLFRVLAVVKPKMTCACSLEAFEKAIISLPEEDLIELWVENKPIESLCDYCGKTWSLKPASTLQ